MIRFRYSFVHGIIYFNHKILQILGAPAYFNNPTLAPVTAQQYLGIKIADHNWKFFKGKLKRNENICAPYSGATSKLKNTGKNPEAGLKTSPKGHLKNSKIITPHLGGEGDHF